jgi:hypothetical protein
MGWIVHNVAKEDTADTYGNFKVIHWRPEWVFGLWVVRTNGNRILAVDWRSTEYTIIAGPFKTIKQAKQALEAMYEMQLTKR